MEYPTWVAPLVAFGILAMLASGCSKPERPPEVRQSPSEETTRGASDHASRETEPGLASDALELGNSAPRRRALLVGVTNYPALSASRQLRGPANDVLLMRETLLHRRFGFRDEEIVILSESEGKQDESRYPTRANIKREFETLAMEARSGDTTVILLAGHGAQQPDKPDPDYDDPEPDGLDEVFLPRDIGHWDKQIEIVANAITDDEIYAWTAPLVAKGVHLCAIFDACHSGSMIRGMEDQVAREVPMSELGVPLDVVERAASRGIPSGATRGAKPTPTYELARGGSDSNASGSLVAIYAAQSNEPEYECTLPLDRDPGAKGERHGMLTYTICEILNSSSRVPTYEVLVRKLWARYLAWSHPYPTPFLDATDPQRIVLGGQSEPSVYRLSKKIRDDRYEIDAGALHGLTKGSILAVYPGDDVAGDRRPLGHVKIVAEDLSRSEVAPCDYRDMPADGAMAFPIGCVLELVYVDYGDGNDLRIPLAIDHSASTDEGVKSRLVALEEQLSKRAVDAHSPFVLTKSIGDAAWIIQPRVAGVELLPRFAGETTRDGQLPISLPRFPVVGVDLAEVVNEYLLKVFRATNLGRLAGIESQSRPMDDQQVSVKLEMLRCKDKNDRKGIPIGVEEGRPRLEPGEYVTWRVTNLGRAAVDITLLYIDTGWGIESLFPRPTSVGADNRLNEKQSFTTPPIRVTREENDQSGQEQVILISVEAEGPQIDFRWLAQPTIAAAREISETTRGANATPSPFERLLEFATYADGANEAATRGLDTREARKYRIAGVSWETIKPRNEGLD